MEKDPDSGIETVLRLPHYLALERLAADALRRADYALALQYSDRRCRILPLPLPHCFVMRAEAAWQLGRAKRALDDLDQALSIDPHDLLANRRMMVWADDERRQTAANRLIASDKSASFLKTAIALLKKQGHRAWASTSINDGDVVGWAAWTGTANVVASFREGDRSWKLNLVAEPAHPLSKNGVNACAFRIARPQVTNSQQVVLTCNGEAFHSRRIPIIGSLPLPITPQPTSDDLRADGPTVIVPVYADAAATAACLDSLLASRKIEAFQILVVDDASPEPDIKDRIASLAAAGQIQVLTNAANLGFVGSINRAIQHATAGDIILLNSDTLVPPGFASRLAAVANQEKNIGTVTPISNNGEFLSFPIPNIVNSLENYDEVVVRDQAAAKANAGMTVDLPSGIGFCLYITRRCLNAIGGLSEEYDRGYLEDVDFCLRAKAQGLRSVCAPSIYVGHFGSRSFGKEKRALVVKNLDALDRNFPGYRSGCKAFVDADPLRPARAALERELPYNSIETVLIVCGAELFMATALARAQQHAANGCRSFIISTFDSFIRLAATDSGPPQSIELELNTRSGIESAARDLKLFNPSHMEIIGESVPCQLVDIANQLGLSFDVWIVSARTAQLQPAIAAARTLFAPTFEAFFLASSRGPTPNSKFQSIRPKPLFIQSVVPNAPKTVAIVTVTATQEALLTIRAILDEISSRGLGYNVVVAGTTFDDAEVMSYPRTFVTGPVKHEGDLADALIPYNVVALVVGFDEPIFGHPKIEATRNGHLPVAFVDWSKAAKRRKRDLAIPDTADHKTTATMVANWLESGCAPA
jgi:O-antigen biosynthesis protein